MTVVSSKGNRVQGDQRWNPGTGSRKSTTAQQLHQATNGTPPRLTSASELFQGSRARFSCRPLIGPSLITWSSARAPLGLQQRWAVRLGS
ncbi:hypothetical protein HPB50_021679 [Hyalomma asiaticum]|uniref:Uncharacterized protein n=1 Tax=Hyalomma asiaticum TaxID=266040 RepID=A0ACB7TDI8_HYAAI|nr:hypothetical protein HPB50_021679 [Hyalomma asiaticum]